MCPRAAIAAVIAVLLAGCAQHGAREGAAAPDPARGHAVAELWCSECHRVSPEDASGARPGHIMGPPVEAPAFDAVAQKPHADEAYLTHFLSEVHPPMPTYRLTDAERADVIAYILSLQ